MNLEEINKWLDEEYGCSYTRLGELHDFYFEKYTDQKQEIQRLNNIIEELEKYINDTENWYIDFVHSYIDKKPFLLVENLKNKLKELKEDKK